MTYNNYTDQKTDYTSALNTESGVCVSLNRDVLVRIKTTRFKFPMLCPICGTQATRNRTISKIKKDQIKQTINSNVRYRRWSPASPTSTIRFSLEIPVCEKHYKSLEEIAFERSFNALLVGMTTPIAILLGLVIAFNFYDGVFLPIEFYLLEILSCAILFLSYRKLGPSDVEKIVSIVDFVQGNPTATLRVRNPWYVNEILTMNHSARILTNKQM